MSVEVDAAKSARVSSNLKFAVLGNCQMGHVTRCLQALTGGEWPTNEWINFEIVVEMADGRRDLSAYFDRHDKIFMQPWIWKGLERRYQHMRHKVVLYPAIEFLAYHPDLVYIADGAPHKLLAGPGGHYNSSIALLAWKAGLSVADAIKLYRRDVYRRLGFFDFWESSCADLRAEGQAAGLPLDSLMQRWIERGCFMHSVNHPKLFVIADVITQLLERLEIRTLPGDPMRYVRDYLADSIVWPVYPEIGEGLGIAGGYDFKLSAPGIQPDCPVHSLGLDKFVELSFAAFSEREPHQLGCSRLDTPPYRELMEDLSAPAAARSLIDLQLPVSQDSGAAAAAHRRVPSLDPVDLAEIEEARMLFKPASVFWNRPA